MSPFTNAPPFGARGRALLALREMLLRGEFPPGRRIEEIDLSRSLQVSRPILRSALEHLTFEGLLEAKPSGGFEPRHFTLDDIRDAILARSALEGQAANLAAQRIQDPSELSLARGLNAQLAQSASSNSAPTPERMARFGDLNAAIHSAFVAIARSPMLIWCLERVQSAAFASPAAVVLPVEGDGARRSYEQHEAILNAIQARDAALAEQLVRKHSEVALTAIEKAAAGRPHVSRNIALTLVGKKPAKAAVKRPGRAPAQNPSVAATSIRILDAAADVFCEKGFHAATTRELANRLHIKQASLYHHISSKEELLQRICQPILERFLAEVPAAVNRVKTPHARIGAFIGGHLQVMLDHPRHTLAMISEFRALSRAHVAVVLERSREYSGMLEAELIAAQQSGCVREDVPAKPIRLALLNMLNWTPRWFQPSGPLSLHGLSRICEQIFWEGVVYPRTAEIPSVAPLPAARRHPARDARRGTLGRFVRAAAELFSKYGYESTSTRDLADLLGVEKATLYYHVEGKQDLLYTICKSSIEQLNADVTEALEGVTNPLAQLQVLMRAHLLSLLRDQTQHATALAEARALTGERLASIVAMRKNYQARMRALITAGQKSGLLRGDIEAKYLGLVLEGLLDRTVIWYRRSGELTPAELAEAFSSLFLSGALRRPS